MSVAVLFDPRMLQLTALEYASPNTILFQRLSVVVVDVVFFFAVVKYLATRRRPLAQLRRFCEVFHGSPTTQGKAGSPWSALVMWLTILHPGLLLVDRAMSLCDTPLTQIQTCTSNTTALY